MVRTHFLYIQVLHIWIGFTLSPSKSSELWTFASGTHVQHRQFMDKIRLQMHLLKHVGYQLLGGEGPIHVGPVKAMLSKFTFSMQGQWIEM